MSEESTNMMTGGQSQATETPAKTEQEVVAKILKNPVDEAKENKNKDLSANFAALARKEKKLREQELKYKSEYETKKPFYEKGEKLSSIQSRIKEDPTAVQEALDLLGIDYDTLTKVMLSNPPAPKDPEVSALKAKIEEMERIAEESKTAAQRAQEEKNILAFKSQIKSAIKPDVHEFCHVAGEDAIEQAFMVCEQYFNETGEMLPIDKSIDYVENYLEQQFSKFKTTKKLGLPVAPPVGEPNKQPPKDLPATLTNAMPKSSPVTEDPYKGMSDHERIKAIAKKYSTQNK